MNKSFLDDIGYLYNNITTQDSQILNEESEYYNEEFAELVVDILATISSSMVYEGYSANAIISFLETSSEQDIIEKYLSFDENILTESTVSEDYIVEQLEIFDFAISEGLGSLIGKVAKGALSLAGRVASKPARMKVAQKMMSSKDPAKTAAAVDRLARMKLNRAGAPSDFTKNIVDAAPDVATKTKIAATAPALGGIVKGVQKVKDIAKGAKAALTSPTAKKIGLGALGAGALVGLPYAGAKLAGAGGENSTAKTSPGGAGTPSGGAVKDLAAYRAGGGGAQSKKAGMAAADVENLGRSNLFKAGGGNAQMKKAGLTKQQVMDLGSKNTATKKPAVKPASTPSGGSGSGGGSSPSTAAKPTKPAAPAKPAAKGPAIGKTKGGTEYQIRTPDAREMAASKAAGGGEEGVKAAVAASQPTTGPTNAKVDTKAADAALAAENERLKKGTKPTTQKESYDAYDLVLNYLFETGQVDTISEAHYIMMELDADAIGGIVEAYF